MSLYTSLTKFNRTKVKRKGFKVDFKAVAYILLTFVPLAITWTHFFTIPVEAAWYDPGYSFRKRIPITNSSGTTQTDFQMQTTIDTASLISAAKMQSDCDDIRFTDIGGTSLSYWLEPNTCNTASTIVFFKVPRISSSTLGTTADVYFYYGNPTATSESSTTNTFIRDMDGAVVNYPLDDTTTTQPYSRVVNEGVDEGRNIVLNGTFDTDTVWTKGANWTISGGVLTHTAGGGTSSTTQVIPLTIGKAYEVSVTLSNVTAGSIQILVGSTGNGAVRATNGTFTEKIVASGNTTLSIFQNAGLFAGDIDNISVRQINIPASNATQSQLLADGNMEAVGTSSWTVSFGATLSKQTTSPHGGSQVLRVVGNGSGFSSASTSLQTTLVVGSVYRVTGYTRSDGTALPRIQDNTARFTGTNSTNWQPFDFVFVANSTNLLLMNTSAVNGTYAEFDDVTVSADNAIRQGEILQDPDMEMSGTSYWVENFGGAATITKETTSPHGGSQVVRILRTAGGGGSQQFILATGRTYRVTGYVRSDGTNFLQLVHGSTQVYQSGTSTSWVFFDATFVASATNLLFRVANANASYIELDDISVTEINPLIGKPTNGVVLGATANGHLSTSYSFDGSNDAVNIYSSDLNSIFNPDEVTMVAWAKVSGSGIWSDGASRIISLLRADVNNTYAIYKTGTNTVSFQVVTGGVTKDITVGSITHSGWMQLVLTVSKSNNEAKAYINGAQVGSTQTGLGTWVGNLGTGSTVIGALSSSGSNPWSGRINDVRIYDRALTSTEISDQYSASSDIQAYTTNNYPNKELLRKYSTQIAIGTVAAEEVGPGPVAEWNFDEGQGQVVQDGTRNNNDGVLGANSGISTDDPTWQSEDMCVSGKCLRFDGSNDLVTLATAPKASAPYSVDLWFKPQELGRQQTLTTFRGGGTYPEIMFNTNNRILVYSGDEKYVYGGKIFTANDLNKWWHVVVVIDNPNDLNTWKVYVNAINSGNTNGSNTGTYYNPSTSGAIGSAVPGGRPLKGFLDEIKVYPYARSSSQVKESFNLGVNSLGVNDDKSYLSDGLVGYWKMDEASWNNNCSTDTVLDSSGNNNHGDACPVTTGPTGGVAGKFGNGGSFDGINDSVQIPHTSSLSLAGGRVSLSMWVYTTSNATGGLFAKRGSPNSFQLNVNSGIPSFAVWHNGGSTAVSATAATSLPLNQWNHIAATANGTEVTLYINGARATGISYDGTIGVDPASSFVLASINGGAGWINANIDDVRMYNKGLTPSEISELYTWAPGPVMHLRMDESSGQVLGDSSAYGNNGQLGSTSSSDTTDPIWTEGKSGGGLSFDGDNDYITVTDSESLKPKRLTASVWIKPSIVLNTIAENFALILDKYTLGGGGYRFIYQKSTDTLYASIFNNGTAYQSEFTSAASLLGTSWHNLSFTFDETNIILYLDGVVKDSTPAATTLTYGTETMYLGTYDATQYEFPGVIDEVRIYNYPRTQTQILSDMEANVAGTSVGTVLPNPLAHYKFDEQSGQIVNNSGIGGSSLNGTLGAGAGAEASDPTWKNKESCKSNACLDFNGTSNNVRFANVPNLGSSSYTISGWMNVHTQPTYYSSMLLSSASGFVLYYTQGTDGTMDLATQIFNGTAWTQSTCDTNSNYNKWYYITLVYDENTSQASLYQDGKLCAAPKTIPGGMNNNYLTTLYSGSYTSNYFDGNIDEIKIYNTALTADQVKLDYNAGSSLNFGATSVSEASILTGGAGSTPNLEWNLDEKTGSTTKDISGNNLTGTINGASWTQGKEGAALRFDGTDDYVTVADNAALNLTTITLEAWVKFNTVNGTNKTIVAKWQPGVKQQYVLQLDSDNKLAFWTGNGTTGGSRLASATTPVANTWYHVVATASGTTKNLYINGRLDATTAAGFALAGSSDIDFSLGSKKNGAGTYFEFLDGSIDKVKVYNYVRSQAQISYNYNRGLPVAHYKLDECQGDVANDSSGNGNSGTINIGSLGANTIQGTCSTSGSAWANGASGKFNSSLNFDGTDDYINLGNPTSLSFTNNLSVSTWIKTTQVTAGAVIRNRTSGYGLHVNVFAGLGGTANKATFWIHNGSSFYLAQSTTSVNDGQWHHVQGVFNGNTIQIYVDGKLEATTNTTGSILPGSTTAIGRDGDANTTYFIGAIDDLRLYNYPLSIDQVKQVMNGGAVRFGPTTESP